ncbi:hypothetical protein C1879_11340 [Paraeggerthella hongkongensis]|uniref:prepilin-type N-terminal cleavage/methylation domain-containing protein n=1 Tax=Paraeggerthella sp. TaxID=2897350 RepID=UPI000DF76FD4|nr:hypothetical protein C1879_11340 [Paraeggerthella hongkongensis]
MENHAVARRFASRQAGTAGFTLAELLVVVAIVLVLVAIAVPVFTGATQSAEEAACAANRRSLKVMVADNYLLTDETPTQSMLDGYVAQLKEGNGNHDLCPAGGSYSLALGKEPGNMVVKCSKHGLSSEDAMVNWLGGQTWTGKTDDEYRQNYAKAAGITEWPSVQATDGKKTYYLQFKSYDNSSAHVFLYAGPEKRISEGDRWKAKYICDNNGLVGEKGQWYELPAEESIAMSGNGAENALRNLLQKEGVKKVNLENEKFVAVSQ